MRKFFENEKACDDWAEEKRKKGHRVTKKHKVLEDTRELIYEASAWKSYHDERLKKERALRERVQKLEKQVKALEKKST